MARSPMQSRSVSVRRALKTELCLGIGKAIWSLAVATARSRRLVERQTRYVMLVKLDGKDTQTVVNALIKHARKLPQELYNL
jgi:hypothetical protein